MRLLNSILSSIAFGGDPFATRDVEQDLRLGWQLQNNCGPRPSGPMYPPPPNFANGDPEHAVACDIIQQSVYIAGYVCEAPCQADVTMNVKLYCNCHIQVGPLQFIKQCEWDYEDQTHCPSLTTEPVYDWECDPRVVHCEDGQYNSIEENDPMMNDYVMEADADTEHEEIEYDYHYEEEHNTTLKASLSTSTQTTTATVTTPVPQTPEPMVTKKTVIIATTEQDQTPHQQEETQTVDRLEVYDHKFDGYINKYENYNVSEEGSNQLSEESVDQVLKQNVPKSGTSVIQNIIDFRPVFERLFDGEQDQIPRSNRMSDELDLYGVQDELRAMTAKLLDDSIVTELKLQNKKLQSKLNNLTAVRAEQKATNDQLTTKLRVLTHYIKNKLTIKDESAMFEELYDIKTPNRQNNH